MPNWIEDFVNDLPLQPNGRLRMDCPACGKKNTFSVGEENGQRMWHCFHANCHTSGRTGFRIRKDAPYHPLLAKVGTVRYGETEPADVGFQIPDTFVSLSREPKAESYVKRVNAYDAYQEGRADIRYDFRMNRVVYMIKEGNRVVDAAGRSLDPNVKPKWWRYGKSSNPFVCGGRTVGVVMEDCASACSISGFLSGIALLGTNLTDAHLSTLRTFERLVVALDKDATSKAISMVRRLQAIRPTSLIILDKDVKDMTNDERKRTFERYIP